jgi:hypothetical protein
MTRDELVLAAMAPGGGYRYTPVQVQRLLFLIDRQIPEHVGGPHFHFIPYHCGPFDGAVYNELDLLAATGDGCDPGRVWRVSIDGTIDHDRSAFDEKVELDRQRLTRRCDDLSQLDRAAAFLVTCSNVSPPTNTPLAP